MENLIEQLRTANKLRESRHQLNKVADSLFLAITYFQFGYYTIQLLVTLYLQYKLGTNIMYEHFYISIIFKQFLGIGVIRRAHGGNRI